jgi:hypothetical protein
MFCDTSRRLKQALPARSRRQVTRIAWLLSAFAFPLAAHATRPCAAQCMSLVGQQLGQDRFVRHQRFFFFEVMDVTLAFVRDFPCKASISRSVGTHVDSIARSLAGGTWWMDCPG